MLEHLGEVPHVEVATHQGAAEKCSASELTCSTRWPMISPCRSGRPGSGMVRSLYDDAPALGRRNLVFLEGDRQRCFERLHQAQVRRLGATSQSETLEELADFEF
jgi:hypothetical protein